jgi:glycosyltransferase involved in cell wall biosynthesis
VSGRIALINQRYGEDVAGGSETYTRLLAQKLCQRYDVEILTTCARDHMSWENHYPPGPETVGGIAVRRFLTERTRDMKRFERLSRLLGYPAIAPEDRQREWIDEQGPYVPGLIRHIRDHRDDFDAFIFVTYLFYTTVYGIREAAGKTMLIPTAHDEPALGLSLYRDVFITPKAIGYLSVEEMAMVHGRFDNGHIPHTVLGCGIDVPQGEKAGAAVKALLGTPYIAYVGRIEGAKGCTTLFDYFCAYKRRNGGDLRLVLMGNPAMEVPKRDDIAVMGFVSEEDKFAVLGGAKALVLPSRYESLSMAVLEAMAVGTPVVVNGRCDVLRGHCTRSNAGLHYADYFEFEGCLNAILSDEGLRLAMGENGRQYVARQYAWEGIMDRLYNLIDTVFLGEETG